MRDPDALGYDARVMNVLPGTTGPGAMDRGAMVIELERDANDVVLLRLEQRRCHRRIDAAGHGDDHPGILRTSFEIETVEHPVVPL
jgi:hypothetical protein